MKITRVEAIRVAVPIEAPILTCYGSLKAYNRQIIKVHTDEGLVGLGETLGSVPGEQIEALGNVLQGWNPWHVGRIRARLGNWGYYQRHELAIVGIELACLDLAGKEVGKPVHELLGGKLRDEIEAAAYLFFRHANDQGEGEIASPEAMCETARAWRNHYGFRTVKVKGGVLPPEREVAALRLIAEELGDEARLRIDPQGCWSPGTAMRAGRAMEDLPMEYLEDPSWGMGAMAEVRERVRVPLATNMCVTSFDHLKGAVAARPVDVILSDVWYWGGVEPTQALDTCSAPLGFGIGMHANCELGIGLAAMLHVASVMVNLKTAIDVMHPHAQDDITTGAFVRPVDGAYRVPDGPGLGVALDDDKVERYRSFAAGEGARDRVRDPSLPDHTRPGWYPVLPAW